MDIADQVTSLLNSPDAMEKIRSVAAGLFGGEEPSPPPSASPANSKGLATAELLQNAENMGNIMRFVSLLNGQASDRRVELLLALKPHLSEERGKKVDKAISILKLYSLLPILKSEGLLDNLL